MSLLCSACGVACPFNSFSNNQRSKPQGQRKCLSCASKTRIANGERPQPKYKAPTSPGTSITAWDSPVCINCVMPGHRLQGKYEARSHWRPVTLISGPFVNGVAQVQFQKFKDFVTVPLDRLKCSRVPSQCPQCPRHRNLSCVPRDPVSSEACPASNTVSHSVETAALERLQAVLQRTEDDTTTEEQTLDPGHEELIGLIESRKQKVDIYGTKALRMMDAMSWKEGQGLGNSAEGMVGVIEAKGKIRKGDKRGIGSSDSDYQNPKRGRHGEVAFVQSEVLAPEPMSQPVALTEEDAAKRLQLAKEADELKCLRLAALASMRKEPG